MIFEGNDIVKRIRTLVGATSIEKAVVETPDSLRAHYGLIKGTNSIHASDSPASGIRESSLWMYSFDLETDKKEAQALCKSYIDKFEGKFPEDVAAVRAQCNAVACEVSKLKSLLESTTDDDMKKQVSQMISIIVQSVL
jgi:hypothetical protein